MRSITISVTLYFDTNAGEQIHVKVGISGASAEGAARNMHAEIPAWDFERARREAAA